MRRVLTYANAHVRRVADLPTSPRSGAAVPGAPEEPELDVGEIQGNSLAGFNKDYQQFLFFRIRDAAGARRWLKGIVPHISTLSEVLSFNRLFRSLRVRQGGDPPGIVATWMNIAFSARGIALLASPAEATQLQDPSFQGGLFNASGGLGDPADRSGWKFGGTEAADAHIVLMIASDDADHLKLAVKRILDGAAPLECIWNQPCATLPGDLRGHEHFGFKDGISQPAPRGRVSVGPLDYLSPRWIAPDDDDALQFSKPGRPLIWPGQFVLGYPRQNSDDGVAPGTVDPTAPAWAKNGSYVVVRRLQQRVDEFHAFMDQAAKALSQVSGFAGMTAPRLAALLVGRWPSGAPVMRTPLADLPALGNDDLANNHFAFADDPDPDKLIPLPGYPGDTFPQATGDFDGLRCPLASHIRKVNPRDQDTDLRSPLDTFAKMILRRGIPYGATSDADKGLFFVSYQASILSQFEFLIKDWANQADAPRPVGGIDLIIGQHAGDDRSRSAIMRSDTNTTGSPVKAPRDFVVPTGGGYFFSPSLSAMTDWASRTT